MAATRLLVLASLLLFPLLAFGQGPRRPDPEIAAAVNRTPAIDNHTHVPRLLAAGERDDEYDALPCGGYVPPSADQFITRPEESKLYPAAWNALWGAADGKQAAAARAKKRAELGDKYAEWVLDRLSTDIMFANRIALGRGLNPPRFRWVPFADALMYPLHNGGMTNTPDGKFFYGREQGLIVRYAHESGLSMFPPTLDAYLAKVVTPTLERWKKQGAVAIKFETAYLRALDIGPADQSGAARVYARYVRRGEDPPPADYKLLQDFLFRYMAAEAGRLRLPVHIHTGAGCGSYFFLNGSDPALLDDVLNDEKLRDTRFVLVHAGWPFDGKAAYLMGKPNVYADLSYQNFFLPPDKLAHYLREYLEWYPEKILWGTDLFPINPPNPELDWEEIGWVTNKQGRDALALALTDMVNAGEISRERAIELARMVMRENAVRLYGF